MKRSNHVRVTEFADEKELKRVEETLRRNAEITNEHLIESGGTELGEIAVFSRSFVQDGETIFVVGWEEVSDSVIPS